MTVTTGQLLELVVQSIKEAKTDAGEFVYSPRTWPTWKGNYPSILCRALYEVKESQGPAAIEFDVTAIIRISGRAQAPALREDAGAADVETALWRLQRQIEIAVINNPIIMLLPNGDGDRLKHYPKVETHNLISAETREPTGELMMDVSMQFYQGPEDFCPIPLIPLEEIQINADLVNVFDANGAYARPPMGYPVKPPPRTSGPDGRNEGALDIVLPQE